MKNKVILLFALASLAAFTAEAQSYQWDTYGIGFTVTDDFVVQTNTDEQFYAVSSDGLIDVNVIPWSDASVNKSNLEAALIDFVNEELNIRAELDGDEIKLNDFDGYFIVAAYEGDMLLVAFLLDTQSATNLIVQIGFEEGNEDEAIDILTSFYAYD